MAPQAPTKIPTDGGLIKTIIIIVIALLIISYLGINLRSIVNSPTTQSNFSYVWNGIVYIWQTYLQAPATVVWNFFLTYIWDPAIRNLEHLQTLPPASTSAPIGTSTY